MAAKVIPIRAGLEHRATLLIGGVRDAVREAIERLEEVDASVGYDPEASREAAREAVDWAVKVEARLRALEKA